MSDDMHERRWYQFSLKTLLIVAILYVVLVAVTSLIWKNVQS